MTDTLNVASVHKNGNPELVVGIRSNLFKISKSNSLVSVTNPTTNAYLDLRVNDLITKDGTLGTLWENANAVFGNNNVVDLSHGGTGVTTLAALKELVGGGDTSDLLDYVLNMIATNTYRTMMETDDATETVLIDDDGYMLCDTWSYVLA